MQRLILLIFLLSNVYANAQNIHDKLRSLSNAAVLEIGEIGDFHNGYAIYRKGERYGMMDKSGKDFIPLGKYSFSKLMRSEGFKNGMCLVQDAETEKLGAIDSTGKLVVPCIYHSMSGYLEDGCTYADDYEGGYHGYFINKKGKRYARPDFYKSTGNEIFFLIKRAYVSPRSIAFRKNSSKAFSMDYDAIKYGDGYFKVRNSAEKYGFIDTTGKLIIPCKFSNNIEAFNEGFARYTPQFQDEYFYSFINKSGEEAFRLKKTSVLSDYRDLRDFKDGYADCNVKYEGKYADALIDKSGKTIVIQNLFKEANPQFTSDLYGDWNSGNIEFNWPFGSIQRNSIGILIRANVRFKPNSITAGVLATGRMEQSGGIGPKDSWYPLNGAGTIDYNGKILVPPVFNYVGLFDEKSGLAKAIYGPEDQPAVQGFINTKGEFVMIIKDNIANFRSF